MQAKNSIVKRTALSLKKGRFARDLAAKFGPDIIGLRYLFHNPRKGSIALRNPAKREPDPKDSELVERIFCSYKKMKKDQTSVTDSRLLPSKIWQDHINNDYAYLTSGLAQNDLARFHYFLENFGNWDTYTGIENTPLMIKNASKARKLYVKVICD